MEPIVKMLRLRVWIGLVLCALACGCGGPPHAATARESLVEALLAAVDQSQVHPTECTLLLPMDELHDQQMRQRLFQGLDDRFQLAPTVHRLPVDPMKAQTGESENNSALASMFENCGPETLILCPGWIPGIAGIRKKTMAPAVIAFCPNSEQAASLLESGTLSAAVVPQAPSSGGAPSQVLWQRFYQVRLRE